MILEPKEIKSVTVSILSPFIYHEVMGPDAMILVFWLLSFKSAFSLSSFTFFKRLFSSSRLTLGIGFQDNSRDEIQDSRLTFQTCHVLDCNDLQWPVTGWSSPKLGHMERCSDIWWMHGWTSHIKQRAHIPETYCNLP